MKILQVLRQKEKPLNLNSCSLPGPPLPHLSSCLLFAPTFLLLCSAPLFLLCLPMLPFKMKNVISSSFLIPLVQPDYGSACSAPSPGTPSILHILTHFIVSTVLGGRDNCQLSSNKQNWGMKKLYTLAVVSWKMWSKHFKVHVWSSATHHSTEDGTEEDRINIHRAPNSFQHSGYELLS